MINVSLITLLISAVVIPKHLQTFFEGYMLVKQDFQSMIYFEGTQNRSNYEVHICYHRIHCERCQNSGSRCTQDVPALE